MNATTRLSHAACSHPSTKVARAKCRRDSKKTTIQTVTRAAERYLGQSMPLMLMPAPAALSRTEYCSICSVEFETIAPESFDIDPVCHVCADIQIADVQQIVTRENWREYKGQTVTVVADAFTIPAEITGWSEKNLQYRTTEGKTVRIATDRIVSVTV